MTQTKDIQLRCGARLHILLDGAKDAPALTLTHSLAASSTMWDPQVSALRDHFRIVRIDIRGHGGSSTSPVPADFDRLAQDVVEVWDTLSIESSNYVGLSLGGIIGAGLGIHHAPRLGRLVLADCRFDASEGYLANWAHRRALMDEGGMAAIADYTLPTWLTAARIRQDPELVAELRAGIEATDPDGWKGIVALFPMLDYKKDLGRITVPTLFATGAEDAVSAEMEACSALVAGARFHRLANASHLANRDQPEAFTAMLTEFLRA